MTTWYKVVIDMIGCDGYRYTKLMLNPADQSTRFRTQMSALEAIEHAITSYKFDAGRAASFRSHCRVTSVEG